MPKVIKTYKEPLSHHVNILNVFKPQIDDTITILLTQSSIDAAVVLSHKHTIGYVVCWTRDYNEYIMEYPDIKSALRLYYQLCIDKFGCVVVEYDEVF